MELCNTNEGGCTLSNQSSKKREGANRSTPGSLADVNRPIEQPAQLRVGVHRAQKAQHRRDKGSGKDWDARRRRAVARSSAYGSQCKEGRKGEVWEFDG